jgi:hypothetical protein
MIMMMPTITGCIGIPSLSASNGCRFSEDLHLQAPHADFACTSVPFTKNLVSGDMGWLAGRDGATSVNFAVQEPSNGRAWWLWLMMQRQWQLFILIFWWPYIFWRKIYYGILWSWYEFYMHVHEDGSGWNLPYLIQYIPAIWAPMHTSTTCYYQRYDIIRHPSPSILILNPQLWTPLLTECWYKYQVACIPGTMYV